MNPKYIKPIPKYIQKQILELDKKDCPTQKGLRFIAYLTKIQGELVKITVALRNKNKKTVLMKQVAIHGVDSPKCLVKDIEYCYLGLYAYKVGWFDEGIKYRYGIRPYYNDGKWYEVDRKYYNCYARIINLDYALKQKEYKYSAVDLFKPICPIGYLRLYKEFPQLEYLAKLGFHTLALSKMILRKIGKDKGFAKWLIKNKDRLKGINGYRVAPVIRAYNKGTDIDYEQNRYDILQSFRTCNYSFFTRDFVDKNKLIDYLIKTSTSISNYVDYYRACEYLNLDLTEDKNLFPHDFNRWHDIRIDEYKTAKALKDKQERAEFYANFENVAEKYLPLCGKTNGAYVVIIAHSPADLTREGEMLHHCVGTMGYGQKMVREESLIFFVRNIDSKDIPFITLEFSLKSKKILQCYGEHNSKPNDDVMAFINKKWLPQAKKQLNLLVA